MQKLGGGWAVDGQRVLLCSCPPALGTNEAQSCRRSKVFHRETYPPASDRSDKLDLLFAILDSKVWHCLSSKTITKALQ